MSHLKAATEQIFSIYFLFFLIGQIFREKRQKMHNFVHLWLHDAHSSFSCRKCTTLFCVFLNFPNSNVANFYSRPLYFWCTFKYCLYGKFFILFSFFIVSDSNFLSLSSLSTTFVTCCAISSNELPGTRYLYCCEQQCSVSVWLPGPSYKY